MRVMQRKLVGIKMALDDGERATTTALTRLNKAIKLPE